MAKIEFRVLTHSRDGKPPCHIREYEVKDTSDVKWVIANPDYKIDKSNEAKFQSIWKRNTKLLDEKIHDIEVTKPGTVLAKDVGKFNSMKKRQYRDAFIEAVIELHDNKERRSKTKND